MNVLDVDSLQRHTVAQFSQPLESWEQLVITDVDAQESIPLKMSGPSEGALLVELRWTPDLANFAIFAAKSFGAETYSGTDLYVLSLKDRDIRLLGSGFLLSTGFQQTYDGEEIVFEAANLDEHSPDSFATYILSIRTAELGTFALEPPRDLWMPSSSSRLN